MKLSATVAGNCEPSRRRCTCSAMTTFAGVREKSSRGAQRHGRRDEHVHRHGRELVERIAVLAHRRVVRVQHTAVERRARTPAGPSSPAPSRACAPAHAGAACPRRAAERRSRARWMARADEARRASTAAGVRRGRRRGQHTEQPALGGERQHDAAAGERIVGPSRRAFRAFRSRQHLARDARRQRHARIARGRATLPDAAT